MGSSNRSRISRAAGLAQRDLFEPSGIPTKPAMHSDRKPATDFRFEAGRGSDLMSAPGYLLQRIDVMMFCSERLVKRVWIWISAKARVAVGIGGRSALSIAPLATPGE